MWTTALLIASLGQCGPYPAQWPWPQPCHDWRDQRGVVVWFYAQNPVEQAKAELRAYTPRSRDHRPPPEIMAQLEELDSRRARTYANLVAAPPDQKAELRRQWLQARADLDRARLAASRRLQ